MMVKMATRLKTCEATVVSKFKEMTEQHGAQMFDSQGYAYASGDPSRHDEACYLILWAK